jgi:hypothetical protein
LVGIGEDWVGLVGLDENCTMIPSTLKRIEDGREFREQWTTSSYYQSTAILKMSFEQQQKCIAAMAKREADPKAMGTVKRRASDVWGFSEPDRMMINSFRGTDIKRGEEWRRSHEGVMTVLSIYHLTLLTTEKELAEMPEPDGGWDYRKVDVVLDKDEGEDEEKVFFGVEIYRLITEPVENFVAQRMCVPSAPPKAKSRRSRMIEQDELVVAFMRAKGFGTDDVIESSHTSKGGIVMVFKEK